MQQKQTHPYITDRGAKRIMLWFIATGIGALLCFTAFLIYIYLTRPEQFADLMLVIGGIVLVLGLFWYAAIRNNMPKADQE